MAQEVVSTQLFGEHLAHNPQNLVPPPLGDCCCLVSGLSQPKAQVAARALENFCHVTAAFLPGTKLKRWPEPICFRWTPVTVLGIYLFYVLHQRFLS